MQPLRIWQRVLPASPLPLLAISLICLGLASAEEARRQTLVFVLRNDGQDRVNVPICLPIEKPDSTLAEVIVGDQRLPAQLTVRGLLSQSTLPHELHFVMPSIPANKSTEIRCVMPASGGAQNVFSWHDVAGRFMDLRWGEKAVVRYVYEPLEESSKDRREQTYKPFHHVFDPDGTRLLTKGPGGLYSHHRGLFFGFNRISYADQKNVDVWHCAGDAYQAHEQLLSLEAGPVLARQRVAIGWHGKGKAVFAREEREVTFWRLPGGHLIDFASRVTSKVGKLTFDGDPQHAGFHFRAAQDVADRTKDQTYFLRPDGAGKPGETRNWDPKTRHGPVNLPWNAMSFVLDGQRYTVAYLDHPQNPKEARFSERDYGRFGSYFARELDEDKPLEVRYRLWVKRGEGTVGELERLGRDFVHPPSAVLH